MQLAPIYEPPKHKIAYKRIFMIAIVILVCGGAYFYLKSYNDEIRRNNYGICGMNNIDTRKIVKIPEFRYEISDYLFYGETLNIYKEQYQLNKDDELYGKSVTIYNLCEDYELIYILDRTADGQIPLEELEPGVYTIYLNQDVKKYQLYFDEAMNDVFYTVTRNGTNNKITMLADISMFDDDTDQINYLNENYLYFIVEEEQIPAGYYDIVLDAGHSSKDTGWGIEYGYSAFDLVESDQTYLMAIELKKELEALGLKVYLTREKITDVIDSYGEKGRLHKAYLNHAKYYIDIQANGSGSTRTRGIQVIHSSFSSNRMANMVNQTLLDETSLVSTGNQKRNGPVGVLPSVVSNGYDGRMMLRESGGRILGAGTYSEASSTNAFFNKDSRYGMQALTIEYFYITNQIDVDIWKEELSKIAKATADGLNRYLRLK